MKKYLLAFGVSLCVFNPLFADPGISSTITVCLQEPAFDLLNALQGTPDEGGIWTDPDGVEVPGGMFTPGESATGTYMYTVDVGDGPETATVDIDSQNCPGSPANNNCGDAQFINPASGIPFSTFGATTDGLAHLGEENCEVNGESQIENDVWYFYTPNCDGEATLSTVGGTTLDTKIAVYSFACPPTTNDLIACNEDFGSVYQSSLTWEIANGGVYLIRIGESPGPGSGNGTFNLSEICFGEEPPENQFCEDAIEVVPSPAIDFSTFNAETDGPDHDGDNTCNFFGDPAIANDVWYTYTATCEGSVTMSTLGGTTLDTRIAVYSDECPNDLTNLIACNDDYQGFGQSQMTWDIMPGEQYILRLGNITQSDGGSGSFSLIENCDGTSPVNDFCDGAQLISPTFGIAFNTFGATTDGPSHFNNPICDFFGGPQIENDVWYEYTASCDGVAEVSTVGGTTLDTRLAVYAEYCPQDLLNLIVCNDDDGSPQSTVTWNVVEGDTYLIRLGEFPGFTGDGGGTGTFNLEETCMEVCAMPVIGYETTCNGLDDFDSFYVSATVVTMGNVGPYLITPTVGDGGVEVSQTGTYEFGPFDNESSVSFLVESLSDEECVDVSYELSANCYPENYNFTCGDLFEAFPNQYTSFTNEESFTWGDTIPEGDCGFEQIHNDLWYAYTAPCDGEATWTTCPMSTFSTRMAVYENSCEDDDLELIACSSPDECSGTASSLTFTTFQGGSYILRLGSTAEDESGLGVFIVNQEIELISAGTDTAMTYCETFNGSIVLNQFLGEFEPGGTWTDDDESGALLGNVLFFDELEVGTYDYSYEVSGPCNTDIATITITYDVCIGLEDELKETAFSIFPNPTSGAFNIRVNGHASRIQLRLFDISGRAVLDRELNIADSKLVQVQPNQQLPAGVYFLKMTDVVSGYTESQKLIVH